MCISMCIHRDMTPHCAFVGGRERSLMPLSDLVLQEISDRIAEMSLELERQERTISLDHTSYSSSSIF